MLVASLLSVLLLGGFAFAGFKALWNYEGAKNVADPPIPLPVSEVGMLATVDDDDVLTTITIFVIDSANGVGGTAVTVPVAVDTAFGIDGMRIPLTEVYATGGPEALAQAVEAKLPATGIVINDLKLMALQQLKDGDKQYLLGGPGAAPLTSIWGVPVAASPEIPFNNFLVGAFRDGALRQPGPC